MSIWGGGISMIHIEVTTISERFLQTTHSVIISPNLVVSQEPNLTQEDIVKEFFTAHPKQDISHPAVVDWVGSECRNIRSL